MKFIIHSKLIISIDTKDSRYKRYFTNEYSRVSGFEPASDAIRIQVKIVKEIPKLDGKDYIYRSNRFKKIFNYQYGISGINSDIVTIYFKDEWFGKLYAKNLTLFLQAQILEPIIYFKLLQKNVLFMHAAGVSLDGNGYLFPAYGGTGKTTLSLGLMGEGFNFLGDDLLLVEPDTGIVYPYLRPLHVFTYNISTLRGAQLPALIKLKVKTKDIIRTGLEAVLKNEFLISTRVHADQLYQDFKPSKPVKYQKILFLTKSGNDTVVPLTEQNINEEASKVLSSFDLNTSLYENILDDNAASSSQELEHRVMINVLKRVGKIEYINTRLLDFTNLSNFKDKLLS